MADIPGAQQQGDWFDQQGIIPPASTAPTVAAQPLQTADQNPRAPQGPAISTAQGANTPQGVMDLWNQFINSQGYAKGPSQWSGGFGGGANDYRGNLDPLVQKFNQLTGLNAKAVSGDKVDFGLGGPQDVITSGGDWWMGNVNGAPGPPGGGGGGGSLSSYGGTSDPSGSQFLTAFGTSGVPQTYNFTPYKLPTLEEVQATPGLQFTLDQQQQGLERSAAAKGGLLSGGALKDITDYRTNAAIAQGYQPAVANSLAAYGANTGQQQFGANYGLNANQQGFGQGLALNQNAFNQDLANRNFGLAQQGQNWNQGFMQNQNAFNQYNTNQNTAFNQWLSLAQLGNPGNPYA